MTGPYQWPTGVSTGNESVKATQADCRPVLAHCDGTGRNTVIWPSVSEGGLQNCAFLAAGEAGGAVEDGPGKYTLLGFISHMGSNTACGHYVCHIRC